MDNARQTWPGCGTELVSKPEPDDRENWTADRQAELMMAGLSGADALRKAMEDWHTYKVQES